MTTNRIILRNAFRSRLINVKEMFNSVSYPGNDEYPQLAADLENQHRYIIDLEKTNQKILDALDYKGMIKYHGPLMDLYWEHSDDFIGTLTAAPKHSYIEDFDKIAFPILLEFANQHMYQIHNPHTFLLFLLRGFLSVTYEVTASQRWSLYAPLSKYLHDKSDRGDFNPFEMCCIPEEYDNSFVQHVEASEYLPAVLQTYKCFLDAHSIESLRLWWSSEKLVSILENITSALLEEFPPVRHEYVVPWYRYLACLAVISMSGTPAYDFWTHYMVDVAGVTALQTKDISDKSSIYAAAKNKWAQYFTKELA